MKDIPNLDTLAARLSTLIVAHHTTDESSVAEWLREFAGAILAAAEARQDALFAERAAPWGEER